MPCYIAGTKCPYGYVGMSPEASQAFTEIYDCYDHHGNLRPECREKVEFAYRIINGEVDDPEAALKKLRVMS